MSHRLDDLIREGISVSDKITASLVKRSEEKAKSCAYGAAQLGLEEVEESVDTGYEDIVSSHNLSYPLWRMTVTEIDYQDVPEEVSNKADPMGEKWIIYGVIYTMNDLLDKSRKAIAEYVTWLIDEKGYDLTVSIDDEDDENEEEEEERELQPA